MTIIYEEEDTILQGSVTDQSALHGLLVRIRDLNLPLLSAEQIEYSGEKNG